MHEAGPALVMGGNVGSNATTGAAASEPGDYSALCLKDHGLEAAAGLTHQSSSKPEEADPVQELHVQVTLLMHFQELIRDQRLDRQLLQS